MTSLIGGAKCAGILPASHTGANATSLLAVIGIRHQFGLASRTWGRAATHRAARWRGAGAGGNAEHYLAGGARLER